MAKLPRPRNFCSYLIAGTLFLILLTACLSPSGGTTRPAARQHKWAEALRALDLADTPTPAYDLTAVYLRRQDNLFQIRVDLLDFKNPKDISLEIRIEDNAAPQAPLLTIRIPSQTDSFRTTLDPLLATVTIELPYSEIPSYPLVNVSTPEDEITGLTLDGSIPVGTAPLLLTFYETFASRFPAEALRSWDGAHTGPRGERHGLKHLLDAVEKYQVPVVLLDLKEPENLSVLDVMGMLPQIQHMLVENLLILPETVPNADLISLCETCQVLELPVSDLAYNSTQADYQFTFLEDAKYLYHPIFSNTTYIPIAMETEISQPKPDGPSIEVRRLLLETALNNDGKDMLVLGGSLANSTWGSPDMVGSMLAYFASRPYIRVLTADDLIGFPTKSGNPEMRSLPLDKSINKLETHYKDLTQPVLDFVANWHGSPLSSCTTGLDKDNQLECVLANEEYLAILDPQGARLTYFFSSARIGNPRNLHQLIGPSWQVAVGLSNPSEWDLSMGEAADPGAYPGAFSDADDPFKLYEPIIEGNTLVFTSLDGTWVKTFALTENGLQVEYKTWEPVLTQIPLLVDPDVRFTSGWAGKYEQGKTPGGIAWGLEDGPMVSVQFESQIRMRAFNEAPELLASPEDPDFDYPPGHYVLFPMAIVEVEMQDGYFLRLECLP